MALDQIARGMFEKHIDAVIDGIPCLMSRVRNKISKIYFNSKMKKTSYTEQYMEQ